MNAHPIDQAFFCGHDFTERQLPARCVLVNYADYQEDEDIRDKDMIHSRRGRRDCSFQAQEQGSLSHLRKLQQMLE